MTSSLIICYRTTTDLIRELFIISYFISRNLSTNLFFRLCERPGKCIRPLGLKEWTCLVELKCWCAQFILKWRLVRIVMNCIVITGVNEFPLPSNNNVTDTDTEIAKLRQAVAQLTEDLADMKHQLRVVIPAKIVIYLSVMDK